MKDNKILTELELTADRKAPTAHTILRHGTYRQLLKLFAENLNEYDPAGISGFNIAEP